MSDLYIKNSPCTTQRNTLTAKQSTTPLNGLQKGPRVIDTATHDCLSAYWYWCLYELEMDSQL